MLKFNKKTSKALLAKINFQAFLETVSNHSAKQRCAAVSEIDLNGFQEYIDAIELSETTQKLPKINNIATKKRNRKL